MLIPDARKVWKKLWSVRLAMLAAAVQGASLFWFALEGTMPPVVFLIVGILLTVAVIPARLLAQKDLPREDP